MKKLVAVSIIAMMLFSSCGKSHNLLEPREPIEAKQTELIESPQETKLVEEGDNKVFIGCYSLYLAAKTLCAFLADRAFAKRAVRFYNGFPYMLDDPYDDASSPDHYVEVVNYNKNAPPGPVASLNIGTKVDGNPVWKEIRGSIPKPA